MDEENEVKKTNLIEKNYEKMDISELNLELNQVRKTVKIIEKTIKNKKKGQNIAEKLFKK